jgi:hypothetical protein
MSLLNWYFRASLAILCLAFIPLQASASDWQLTLNSTGHGLYDIWGLSPTDMFVVGQHGTFMQGSDSSWLNIANNPKASDSYANYMSLWGTSSSNIYIGGGYWNGPNNGKGFLLHYDGSAVSVVADNLPNHILSVSGTGTSDIWAAGGLNSTPLAMHFNGSAWTQQTWGSTKPGEITSVWGTSPSNVYAICGDSSPKGQIWHYNGSSWAQQTYTSTIGYKLWGTDANNIFAVGNMSPNVYHYNGTTWGTLNSGTSSHLFGVGGAGPNDIFVGGENGVVRKYNGSTWTTMSSGTGGMIQDFASPSSNDVFAVTDQGSVLHYVRVPSQNPNGPEPPTPPVYSGSSQLEVFDRPSMTFKPVGTNLGLFDASKPTIVLVHGFNPGTAASINEDTNGYTYMSCVSTTGGACGLARLGNRDDINVLAWDWMPEAQGNPFNPIDWQRVCSRVPGQASVLANSLANLKLSKSSYDQPIQFIGHSAGGGVVARAALLLENSGSGLNGQIDQVTIFDSFGFLNSTVTDLANKGVWVDNYYSALGNARGVGRASVCNVSFVPGLSINPLDLFDNHGYPMGWYFGWPVGSYPATQGTIDSAGNMKSYVTCGASWSNILAGGTSQTRAGASGVTWVMADNSEPYNLLTAEAFEALLVHKILPLVDVKAKGEAYFTEHNSQQYCQMVTHSPVYVYKDITFDMNAEGLSFEFLMGTPEPDDVFALYFGDTPLFVFYGSEFPDGGGFFDSGIIDINQFAGQSGTLTFLYSSSLAGQTAEFGNLELYSTPEPATLSLLALGGLALLRRRRIRSGT